MRVPDLNENFDVVEKTRHTISQRPSSYEAANDQQKAEYTFSYDMNMIAKLIRKLMAWINQLVVQGNEQEGSLVSETLIIDTPGFVVDLSMNNRRLLVDTDQDVTIQISDSINPENFAISIETIGNGIVTVETPDGFNDYQIQKLDNNRGEGKIIFKRRQNAPAPSATASGDFTIKTNLLGIEYHSAQVNETGDRLIIRHSNAGFTGGLGYSIEADGLNVDVEYLKREIDSVYYRISRQILSSESIRLFYNATGGNVTAQDGTRLGRLDNRVVINNSQVTQQSNIAFRVLLSVGPLPDLDNSEELPSPLNSHESPDDNAVTTLFDTEGNQVGRVRNVGAHEAGGNGVASSSSLFPAQFSAGYFFSRIGETHRLAFEDFDDNLFYSVNVLCSREDVGESRRARVQMENMVREIEQSGNIDQYADFYNVSPIGRAFEISYRALGSFAYLNAVEITAYNSEVLNPYGSMDNDPPVVPPTLGADSNGLGVGVQTVPTQVPDGFLNRVVAVPSSYRLLMGSGVEARMRAKLNDSIHADEKDSIDNHQGSHYKILRYSLYNDTTSGREAMLAVQSLLSSVSLSTTGSNNIKSRGWTSMTFMIAFVFSHGKALCGRNGVNTVNWFVERIKRLCWDNRDDPNDSPIVPIGTESDIFSNNRAGGVKYIASHHVSHMTGLLAMSVSIAEYDAQMYNQIAANIIEHMPLAKYAFGRGVTQGTDYSLGRAAASAVIAEILRGIAAEAGEAETRYFPEKSFSAGRAYMYLIRPDGKATRWGDSYEYQAGRVYTQVGQMAMLAAASGDSQLYDFAYRSPVYEDFLMDNSGDRGTNDEGRNVGWMAPLMLAQRELNTSDYRQAPLIFTESYPGGLCVSRSGWNITKNSSGSNDYHVVWTASCNIDNHLPFAQGALFTYMKGVLENHAMIYNNAPPSSPLVGGKTPQNQYNSPHVALWGISTCASSVGYSHSQGGILKSLGDVRQYPNADINPGGQIHVGNPVFYTEDILQDSRRDSLKVSRMHAEEGFFTAMIDSSQAHYNQGVGKVYEITTMIETGDTNIPVLVFTKSFFRNDADNVNNFRLAQSPDDVSVDGNAREFGVTNNLTDPKTTYNGKEFGFVFGDGTLHRWSGYHVDRNTAGSPAGTQYPPGSTRSSHHIGYEETKGVRVDIRSINQNESDIHVGRQLMEGNRSAAVRVVTDEGNYYTVDCLGVLYIVPKGDRLNSSVSFQLSSIRKVAIVGLEPTSKYRDQNGNEYIARSGFAFLETLNAGTYQITKKLG